MATDVTPAPVSDGVDTNALIERFIARTEMAAQRLQELRAQGQEPTLEYPATT
jgi:hypothetical protein